MLFFSVAFSRDNTIKEYVTHKLQANASLIRQLLLQKGASIFVAGSANRMPKDVYDTILRLLTEREISNLSEAQITNIDQNQNPFLQDENEAEQFLNYLKKKKKYSVEAWSN